jgi:hypothetical protein
MFRPTGSKILVIRECRCYMMSKLNQATCIAEIPRLNLELDIIDLTGFSWIFFSACPGKWRDCTENETSTSLFRVF